MKRTFITLFILLLSTSFVLADDDFQDLTLDSLDSLPTIPAAPAKTTAVPAQPKTTAPAKTTAAPAQPKTTAPVKTPATPAGTATTPVKTTTTPAGTATTPAAPRRMKFQTVNDLPGSSVVPSSDPTSDPYSSPVIPSTPSIPGADLPAPSSHTATPAAERSTSSGIVKVNSIPRSVENGLIIPIYEVDVPAEEAGVLMKLYITDFQHIKADDLIVQIDDRQAKMAVNVAEAKKEYAEIQMKNNVNVRYAMAARDVANAEVLQADEANHKVPNTVPVVEYNRLILSRTQATLQIEQAEQEIKMAGENYKVAKAELEAAQLDQTKFEVHSPHDGVVMELYRKEGEWLKPGDPILHLVQMNPIRYSFRIESTTPPESIFNQAVTIYVPTLDKTFQGKVMYIKPSHDIGDMYQVWVDIENQWQDFQNLDGTEKQKGYWILQPGMRAEVRKIGK
ncbi:MAG: HlyD family efflux transporter periplasmic adaptor subunit [Thermoguttaceae bacterium]|nr:HlyD family efflux transporter periplasmic adaptor subunit [Thermoguttaceae bacterium]